MAGMKFAQYLNHGKVGESLIAQWLRTKGYNVLPVYEKELGSGKGPALYTLTGNLIAPDLLAFRNGRDGVDIAKGGTVWIEAKTKSAFSWNRKYQTWVTGIDGRHYTDYLEIMKVSPWTLWVLFLHLNGQAKDSEPTPDTGLFGAPLKRLSQNVHHEWQDGARRMVYWAHPGPLRKLATLEAIEKLSTVTITPIPNGGWEQTRSNHYQKEI